MFLDAGDDATAQVETLENLATPAAEDKTEEPKDPKPEDKRPTGYQRVKFRLEKAEAELAELRAAKATQEVPRETKGKPSWEEYAKAEKSAEQYFEDLADWKADQKITEKLSQKETQQKQADLKAEQQKLAENFRAKAQKLKASAADFESAIEEADPDNWSPALRQSILESDMGPELAYHLAKNPDELERLNALPYGKTARELGKLEAKLETPKEGTKVTKAPPPLEVPRGSGKTASLDPFNNPDMTAEEWKAYKVKLKR